MHGYLVVRDIGKVVGVKSSFGPEFTVTDISERAIDPKLLAARKLPEGLTFDPANCAKVAVGPEMPPEVVRLNPSSEMHSWATSMTRLRVVSPLP